MAWLLLLVAGILEIGWPLGFKLASVHEKYFYAFITLAVVSMAGSGYLLYLAQKNYSYWDGLCYLDWGGGCWDGVDWDVLFSGFYEPFEVVFCLSHSFWGCGA